eukprot:TRINITY_DN91692_c0_g1_i1.p1 TRINITY_DN91692_c0_g1~~TRINITY_DN91692_c0_g1_i1.p1  ORF type:complete len:578 (-),score=236.71 TRINITY_DN91692_c0_g1_i1:147-1880(-)
MSDEEELPDDMEDDFGDEDMGDFKAPPELPEGIKKEIITASPDDSYRKPKAGDEVTVHYVGTLEADGSEFDSSRSRGKPFEFVLGKGQVISGWDKGVATMKKGEVAKFTLAPEFAYGAAGSPPKIPENATLVFEVELLSWKSKDDLFGDEGVVKTQVQEGSGWKTPKDGDEVLLAIKVEAADVAEAKEEAMEYQLASGKLGGLTDAVDKALTTMKKGEMCSLKLSQEYAGQDASGKDREGGATVSLTLKEIYETRDVSFEKDNSISKKTVVQGESYEMPKDTVKVKLSVEAATDGPGGPTLPGFTAKVLEYTCGNGEVCDVLELCGADMKSGEKAIVTVSKPSLMVEEKVGLKEVKPSSGKVVVTLVMESFEKLEKDTYQMSEEEKLVFGTARKDRAAALFKSGRIVLALRVYKKVAEIFGYVDNYKEEDNKQKAKDMKKACDLNKAACFLKLKNFADAKKECNGVLKEDKLNVKALYRRAQADLGLKNFLDSMNDCKKVIQLDPQNREARSLLKEAQAGQKGVDNQAKGMYANMCKALGKGPIPEPYKHKLPDAESDDDDFGEDSVVTPDDFKGPE